MWDRKAIKSNAKIAIGQGRYWPALAVVFTATAVTLVLGVAISQYPYDSLMTHVIEADVGSLMDNLAGIYALSAAGFLTDLFILYPMTIGMVRFFVQNRFGNTRYSDVFSSFEEGYFNSIGTMFVTNLLVRLWTLLFIIPGIIKALQYFFVPYILSDNPHISGSRARQLSRMLTDGEKGAIFVMQLSFIGWYMLAALAAGIVAAFIPGLRAVGVANFIASICTCAVDPYPQASYAELYVFLRDRAIQSGRIDPAELCLASAEY